MRLLCVLFPPLAVLFCGKPFQAIINFFLTLLLWIPGVIHAWGVVSDSKDDKRAMKQAKFIATSNAAAHLNANKEN